MKQSAKVAQQRAILLAAGLNALLLSGPHLLAGSSPMLVTVSLSILSAWLVAEGLASAGGGEPPSSQLARRLSLAGGLSVPLVYMVAAFDAAPTLLSAVLGTVFLLLGVALRVRSVKQLAVEFVSSPDTDGKLLTRGLFGISRHPAELGLLLLVYASAVFWLSPAALALAALATALSVARTVLEERALRAQFGERYQAYCNRTWRYLGPVKS